MVRPTTLLLFCFLGFLSSSLAVFSGFPKDRCDDMDPTKIPILAPTAEVVANSSDYTFEEPLPTALVISGRLNLFRLVASSSKYRRGRVMDITIKGPEFNAFMLQVRKIGPSERRGVDKPVRVGNFVSWPPTVQPVDCDQGRVTSVTNKNYSPKKDITIKWKAPKEDIGPIHIVGRFIAGEEYWQLSESRDMPISEFPVNLAKCGKAKSCILYSEKSDSCHEDNCDYILTYTVVNNSFVEFVLGGNIKEENTYLAVGFSKDAEAEKLKLVACTKAKMTAEIKYFVQMTPEEGLMEHPMSLENTKMDLDGERMWCSFTVPLSGPADDESSLDFRMPLYHVYMRGKTNHTKTVNIPILPSNLLISKTKVPVEKIKLQYHTMEKLKGSASLRHLDYLIALFGVFMLYRF